MDMERMRKHQVRVAKESILRIEGVRQVLWDQWREIRNVDEQAGERLVRALSTLSRANGILEAHIIISGGDIDE